MKRIASSIVLLLACSAYAEDQEELLLIDRIKERTFVSGTVEVEAAIETYDGHTQKLETHFQPEFEITLPHDIDLTIIPRLRFDTEDRMAPGQPDQDEISTMTRSMYLGDRAELELREMYIEKAVGKSYLTLGKQQVVWGKADGLKVLDVVNPQSFREFTLDDFDDSRIPLWTANLEIPVKSATLQLLWIPDQTYHKIPRKGSVYELNPKDAPPIVREDFDRPRSVIRDSDIGAQLSSFWKGWDLTLNYLYHYDDVPVLRKTIAPGPILTLSPVYERSHLLGGSFSNAFGDLTLRGELGYSFDKYYSTTNAADPYFVQSGDEFSYVIGLDWFKFSNTMLSAQFFQNMVMDDIKGLIRDRVDNKMTFLARRNFRNDTLVTSAILVHSLNEGDGYVRPKVAYDYRDNITLWTGLDIFYGNEADLFGQFDRTDRVLLGMEWGF